MWHDRDPEESSSTRGELLARALGVAAGAEREQRPRVGPRRADVLGVLIEEEGEIPDALAETAQLARRRADLRRGLAGGGW